MRRRKRLPEELRVAELAFRRTAYDVDRARRVLTEAAPSTRMDGRPLADAVLEFEDALHVALDHVSDSRSPDLETTWGACFAAIERALALAERLRMEPRRFADSRP